MSTHHATQLAPQPLGIGLAGSWSLPSSRAIKLGAASSGYLRVAQGTVWATLDGPHHGPANDWGDLVLGCGTRIHLTAGQQVVLESYQSAANEPARFSWEPDALPSEAVSRKGALRTSVGVWLARLLTPKQAPAPEWPTPTGAPRGDQARQAAWHYLRQMRINPP